MAILSMLMEISEYLAGVMVDKGSCVAEYKEQKRRDETKSSIKLE
jgi:hypothetical protein